jgi:Superinfection immunity protein
MGAVGGLAEIAAVFVLYFVPSLVARSRSTPNLGSVVVVNLFLGWTVIGWVVALAMASRSVPATAAVSPGPVLPPCQRCGRPADQHSNDWKCPQ